MADGEESPKGFMRIRAVMALPLLGALLAGVFYLDSRYAKAVDVDALRIGLVRIELRLEIDTLENRRAILLREKFGLTDPANSYTQRDREHLAGVLDQVVGIDDRLHTLNQELSKIHAERR